MTKVADTTKKSGTLKPKKASAIIKDEAERILDKDPSTENNTPADEKVYPTFEEILIMENEVEVDEKVFENIEWIDLEGLKKQRVKEEPLHLMIYFRVVNYPNPKTKKFDLQKHGRITFSHYLTTKFGKKKKYKFGAFGDKVIFQVNDSEGLTTKLASKAYPKNCISSNNIVELIFSKYNLEQSNKSVYFKLKYLGNDFYLIDEIMK
ncbi:MAG TPA: hypothetical protein VIV55_09960 [Flavobacterium sp.]